MDCWHFSASIGQATQTKATHGAAKSGAKVMMARKVARVLMYSKFVDLPCRMVPIDVFAGAADRTRASPG